MGLCGRFKLGPDFDDEGKGKFTGLHVAACLGIEEIFAGVLEMKKWNVNARDCFGGTALTWATERGHEGIVKMLLERGDINPDQAAVNPSVQSVRLWLWTGRTTDWDECPGRTAVVASVLILALDGLPVTAGVLGGAIH